VFPRAVSHVAASFKANYIAAAHEEEVLLFARLSVLAAKALDRAWLAILNEKSKNFSVRSAETLLLEAESKFNAGLYEEARSLADQAYSLAIDVDQDGVLNEYYFAPYVNNYLIYCTGAITFLVFCARASR